MTCPLCGLKSEHIINPVFKRPEGMPYWILMRFYTPFFYVVDGEALYGKAGQLLLQPPETPLIHGGVDGGFCNDWLYFDGDDASALCQELSIPKNIAFDGDSRAYHSLTHAIEAVTYEQKLCDIGHEKKISATLTSMLIDVARACRQQGITDEKRSSPCEKAIIRAHTVITENCAKPWSLSDMAELSGYSVSRFCGLYKKQFGISPTEHLIRIRIDRAKHLLASGLYNVSETAELCGFSSLHYFSLTFKKHVGCPPSLFMGLNEQRTEKSYERNE